MRAKGQRGDRHARQGALHRQRHGDLLHSPAYGVNFARSNRTERFTWPLAAHSDFCTCNVTQLFRLRAWRLESKVDFALQDFAVGIRVVMKGL